MNGKMVLSHRMCVTLNLVRVCSYFIRKYNNYYKKKLCIGFKGPLADGKVTHHILRIVDRIQNKKFLHILKH